MQSQQEKLNTKVELRKDLFLSCKGIFVEIYGGLLTRIVERFQELGTNDVLQLVMQRDEGGRTPLDISWYFPLINLSIVISDSKTLLST